MTPAEKIREIIEEADRRAPASHIAQAYVEGRRLALRECLAIVEREAALKPGWLRQEIDAAGREAIVDAAIAQMRRDIHAAIRGYRIVKEPADD